MNRNNFNSVYSEANTLYGTVMDPNNFEDIALHGWESIGNKQTHLYRYTTNTENCRIQLPCNVEILEAVFSNDLDAQTSNNYSIYPNIANQWAESYIEAWKKDKNVFYNRGKLLEYRLEGDTLVFDREYNNVTILYHGLILDEDGLPYLTDREVRALAVYCAYMDLYKKSLILKDGNTFQLASVLKADWLRLCNAARLPDHLTQNDLDDVLDVKTRWDRKQYSKSFKPIL